MRDDAVLRRALPLGRGLGRTEFNTASPVQSSNQLGDMFRSMLKAVRVGFNVPPNTL